MACAGASGARSFPLVGLVLDLSLVVVFFLDTIAAENGIDVSADKDWLNGSGGGEVWGVEENYVERIVW